MDLALNFLVGGVGNLAAYLAAHVLLCLVPAFFIAGAMAVCSCTIVPLFAGIYRKGAGIGPAMTFLFFAPAGNIMAIAYTGNVLGLEFAAARFLLSLLFGIGIGLLMALLFCRDDLRHDQQTDAMFTE